MATIHPTPEERSATGLAGPGGPEQAVVIVGHGSLRLGAGCDLVRLAAHISGSGAGIKARAAFLNLSRPTLLEALAHHSAGGTHDVIVVPYFLTFGHGLRDDLAALLGHARRIYPHLRLRITRPLGDHPTIARLLHQRALEADYLNAHPFIACPQQRRLHDEGATWQPLCQRHPTALLIAAHGSLEESANQPIYSVARQLRAMASFAAVLVGYMHTNQPSLLEAIGRLVRRDIHNCIAVPYFLGPGNHVATELPTLLATARVRYPNELLLLAEHLSFDRSLLTAVLDRISETLAARGEWMSR